MKHEAIMELYPTVKRVTETTDGIITAFDESGNQVNFDISTVETKATELQTAKNADKVSGNQKLLDLGLTQAEATALTGYTPPAED